MSKIGTYLFGLTTGVAGTLLYFDLKDQIFKPSYYKGYKYRNYYDYSKYRATPLATPGSYTPYNKRSRSFSELNVCTRQKFNTKEEAEKILQECKDAITEYGRCTVKHFLDKAGCCFTTYTDYRYGWKDLSEAVVKNNPYQDNKCTYYIDFPLPEELEED